MGTVLVSCFCTLVAIFSPWAPPGSIIRIHILSLFSRLPLANENVGSGAVWFSRAAGRRLGCHPEQASFAQRGIWARRFVLAHERRASLFKLHHYQNVGVQQQATGWREIIGKMLWMRPIASRAGSRKRTNQKLMTISLFQLGDSGMLVYHWHPYRSFRSGRWDGVEESR